MKCTLQYVETCILALELIVELLLFPLDLFQPVFQEREVIHECFLCLWVVRYIVHDRSGILLLWNGGCEVGKCFFQQGIVETLVRLPHCSASREPEKLDSV